MGFHGLIRSLLIELMEKMMSNVPDRVDVLVDICNNCGTIQKKDHKSKKCWYCGAHDGFYDQIVTYLTRSRTYDYCSLCGRSPMEAICNNGRCDDKD